MERRLTVKPKRRDSQGAAESYQPEGLIQIKVNIKHWYKTAVSFRVFLTDLHF